MSDELHLAVGRWIALERKGDEAGAEGALALVFQALPDPEPSAGLTARSVAAARRATPAPARRALRSGWQRATRLGLGTTAGLIGLYVLGRELLPLLVTAFVRGVALLLDGVLWVSVSLSAGLDFWTLLAHAGRWVGVVITTPRVAVTLVVIEVIGALALYVIQRVLASEKESSRS
ncbi:MAG TPA: hypothetical protein VNE16_08450 [Vicinamibacterales bacterium]|nr:hypothetical protein [Vicinamibacterales bacterium]